MSIPRTFHSLMNAWHDDAAGHAVEVLAAELAAALAREGISLVAIVEVESVPRLANLALFLGGFGVDVYASPKKRGVAYVFALIDPEVGQCTLA